MANFNLNKVVLGGRLTATPELKQIPPQGQTPSGVMVATFTLAVNRRFSGKDDSNQQTDFINITAWRQTAEFIARYFKKGSSICVAGAIQTRTWTDQQGTKRYATDVVADEVYFVDSKSDVENTLPVPYSEPHFEVIGEDDDLPF